MTNSFIYLSHPVVTTFVIAKRLNFNYIIAYIKEGSMTKVGIWNWNPIRQHAKPQEKGLETLQKQVDEGLLI